MNRANQHALFQQTNLGLLGIRQSEVNYYQSLNVAFGTQAALIGGFTYGVFTQNQVNYSNGYAAEDVIADIYWIFSAITIALSVHVILCTMLMQVLGPGLALNGPVGSMARATEGMRIEQQQIIVSFIAMMIMFSAATVLSCWVVMSFEASVGCSVSFFIAACYWYKYCERIYLRFYWDSEDTGWKESSHSADDHEEDPAHRNGNRIENKNENPLTMANSYIPKELANKSKHNKYNKNTKKGMLRTFFDVKPHKNSSFSSIVSGKNRSRSSSAASITTAIDNALHRKSTDSTSTHDLPSLGLSNHPNWTAVSATRGVIMEGYLTKRGGNTSNVLNFRSEPWERRYFTLTSAGNLYIYKNRHEYRNEPKNPIYTRPLRLSEYYVEVNNSDVEVREANGTESEYMTARPDDSEIKPFRFQMTLILREHVDGGVQNNNNNNNNNNNSNNMSRSSSVSSFSTRTPPSSPLPLSLSNKDTNTNTITNRTTNNNTNTQSRYRDHWVLRCDIEEELQHWVHVMQEVSPSSFDTV